MDIVIQLQYLLSRFSCENIKRIIANIASNDELVFEKVAESQTVICYACGDLTLRKIANFHVLYWRNFRIAEGLNELSQSILLNQPYQFTLDDLLEHSELIQFGAKYNITIDDSVTSKHVQLMQQHSPYEIVINTKKDLSNIVCHKAELLQQNDSLVQANIGSGTALLKVKPKVLFAEKLPTSSVTRYLNFGKVDVVVINGDQYDDCARIAKNILALCTKIGANYELLLNNKHKHYSKFYTSENVVTLSAPKFHQFIDRVVKA